MSLGKMIKKLIAEVNQKTNYGGVQELPMYGIGYDERDFFNGARLMMYGKDKKKGTMYGSMVRQGKMVGGRSMYGSGGYASIQDMERMCGSKTVTQKVK